MRCSSAGVPSGHRRRCRRTSRRTMRGLAITRRACPAAAARNASAGRCAMRRTLAIGEIEHDRRRARPPRPAAAASSMRAVDEPAKSRAWRRSMQDRCRRNRSGNRCHCAKATSAPGSSGSVLSTCSREARHAVGQRRPPPQNHSELTGSMPAAMRSRVARMVVQHDLRLVEQGAPAAALGAFRQVVEHVLAQRRRPAARTPAASTPAAAQVPALRAAARRSGSRCRRTSASAAGSNASTSAGVRPSVSPRPSGARRRCRAG